MKTPPCLTTFATLPKGVAMSRDAAVLDEYADPCLHALVWLPPWSRETESELDKATLNSVRMEVPQKPWVRPSDDDIDSQEAVLSRRTLAPSGERVWRLALPAGPAYDEVAMHAKTWMAAYARHCGPAKSITLLSTADEYRVNAESTGSRVSHKDAVSKAFATLTGQPSVGLAIAPDSPECANIHLGYKDHRAELFSLPKRAMVIWKDSFHHGWPVQGKGQLRHTIQAYKNE